MLDPLSSLCVQPVASPSKLDRQLPSSRLISAHERLAAADGGVRPTSPAAVAVAAMGRQRLSAPFTPPFTPSRIGRRGGDGVVGSGAGSGSSPLAPSPAAAVPRDEGHDAVPRDYLSRDLRHELFGRDVGREYGFGVVARDRPLQRRHSSTAPTNALGYSPPAAASGAIPRRSGTQRRRLAASGATPPAEGLGSSPPEPRRRSDLSFEIEPPARSPPLGRGFSSKLNALEVLLS